MPASSPQVLESALAATNLNSQDDLVVLRKRRTPWIEDGKVPAQATKNADKKQFRKILLDLFQSKIRSSMQHRAQPVPPPPHKSRLQQLPAELVFEIQKPLSLSSGIALSQTCSKFRQLAEVFIGDLFPPCFEHLHHQ